MPIVAIDAVSNSVWAGRVQALGLEQGSVIHLAYKLRENPHPEYGGLELEVADLQPAG